VTERLTDLLMRWHALALFALLTAEEAGVPLPVPGDLFIAAMGVLARSGRGSFIPVLVAVTLATVSGASLLYAIASHAGRPLLNRTARRLGLGRRVVGLERWMARHGALAVVVFRLVPGLRIVTTVAAGALGLDRRKFLAGAFVSGAIWASVYFWLGYVVGAGVEELAHRAAIDAALVAAVVGLVVVVALVVRHLHRRRKSAMQAR